MELLRRGTDYQRLAEGLERLGVAARTSDLRIDIALGTTAYTYAFTRLYALKV